MTVECCGLPVSPAGTAGKGAGDIMGCQRCGRRYYPDRAAEYAMTAADVRAKAEATMQMCDRKEAFEIMQLTLAFQVLRAIANDPTRQDAHLLAQEALRIFE